MACFSTCPRKFLLRERLGLRRKSYGSALSRGTWFHTMVDHRFLHSSTSETLGAVRAEYEKERAKVESWADPNGMLPNGKDLSTVLDTMWQDYQKATAMATAFWSLYDFPASKFEIVELPEIGPMVERLMEFQIPGIKSPVVLRVDALIRNRLTGEIWIVDHKTSSKPPVKRAATMSFAGQARLYWLGFKTRFPSLKLTGWCHNVVRTPTIKCCAKDGFNWENYCKRLIEWYEEESRTKPFDPPILQSWVAFHPTELDSAEFDYRLVEQDTWSTLEPDLVRFDRRGEENGGCMMFNSECEFLPLCTSPVSGWPSELERGYEVSFREDEEDDDVQ